MKCPQCNTEVSENAAFCKHCGAKLAPAAEQAPVPGSGAEQPPAPAQPSTPVAAPAPSQVPAAAPAASVGAAPRKSKSTVIAAVLAVLAVIAVAAVVVVVVVLPGADASKAADSASSSAAADADDEEEDKYHVVTSAFSFDIPEYWRDKVRWEVKENEADAPIHGDKPLLSEVKVYALPDKDKGLAQEQELCTIYATVGDWVAGTVDTYYQPCAGVEDQGIFTEIAVVGWTNGMKPDEPGLAYLVDLQTGGKGSVPVGYYMAASGSAEALEDFTEKELRSSIKSTLTEPEAHELKKAHYHVATDYYEFDIPEYWWGKVEWTTSDGKKSNYNTPMTETEVYFYDSSSKKQTLLRVSSYTFNTSSTVSDVWVGDYSYIGLKEFEEGNRRTRVTPANPAAISVDSVKYNGRLTDGMMKAADLATGGKIKERSQLSDYTAQSATEVTKDFCNKELMPSFKLK